MVNKRGFFTLLYLSPVSYFHSFYKREITDHLPMNPIRRLKVLRMHNYPARGDLIPEL